MKLAIIGGTGKVGTRILAEALRRGHTVKAISRNPSALASQGGVTSVAGDTDDPEGLAKLLAGEDVVISSVPFRTTDPEKLIQAVRLSGVKRYLIVGGASSLEVAPGKLLLDSGLVPEFALVEARSGKVFLDALRPIKDLDWTMLSPSALFTAGERTGVFRLGKDNLLTGADGKSWISYEDFSIGLLDEVENPQHLKSRFTVGY
jgi:putative NADH-flavin reductase